MKKVKITNKTLHFKQPAGTSRGIYSTRLSHYIEIYDEESGERGMGEAAPLPDLGCDRVADYEDILADFCREYVATGRIDYEAMRPYPSMLFALETAHLELTRGRRFFDTPFSRGEEGIPINGLVWMGSYEEMEQRMLNKMECGFKCIKLKIGAIKWSDELSLIKKIRNRFSKEDIELRVDANGGFTPEEAPGILDELARYDIHSVEQPIRQGQWKDMARLCRNSPLPIALDEELIGLNRREDKLEMLREIRPQYLVIKPTLHGGMFGSEEWISLAGKQGIRTWITSALESNIGLNALAQFTAHCYGPGIVFPQGLGTGLLFTDNTPSALEIKRDKLWTSKNF